MFECEVVINASSIYLLVRHLLNSWRLELQRNLLLLLFFFSYVKANRLSKIVHSTKLTKIPVSHDLIVTFTQNKKKKQKKTPRFAYIVYFSEPRYPVCKHTTVRNIETNRALGCKCCFIIMWSTYFYARHMTIDSYFCKMCLCVCMCARVCVCVSWGRMVKIDSRSNMFSDLSLVSTKRRVLVVSRTLCILLSLMVTVWYIVDTACPYSSWRSSPTRPTIWAGNPSASSR